jgi:hypothetical protein
VTEAVVVLMKAVGLRMAAPKRAVLMTVVLKKAAVELRMALQMWAYRTVGGSLEPSLAATATE